VTTSRDTRGDDRRRHFWVIYQRIVLGEAERIESLLPDLVDFALTPYIGAESAQRATARL